MYNLLNDKSSLIINHQIGFEPVFFSIEESSYLDY
jgi:hypothetical protein